MRERPILFSAPMVCAILDGRKTQTRRVAKIPWRPGANPSFSQAKAFQNAGEFRIAGSEELTTGFRCPYGTPGDRLWVKETWADVNLDGAPGIAYRADDDVRDLMEDRSFLDRHGGFNYEDRRFKHVEGGKQGNHFAVWYSDLVGGSSGRWRPAIHMPRWVSRITLEITGVRVERLRDISEDDAKAEGCKPVEFDRDDDCGNGWTEYWYVGGYQRLWDEINGAGAWTANPWVWVVEFKRVAP